MVRRIRSGKALNGHATTCCAALLLRYGTDGGGMHMRYFSSLDLLSTHLNYIRERLRSLQPAGPFATTRKSHAWHCIGRQSRHGKLNGLSEMSNGVSRQLEEPHEKSLSIDAFDGSMHAKTRHVASLLARATSIAPAVVVQWQLSTTHSRRQSRLLTYTTYPTSHRHSTHPQRTLLPSSTVSPTSHRAVNLRHALRAPV
jgi:hypothetical protein